MSVRVSVCLLVLMTRYNWADVAELRELRLLGLQGMTGQVYSGGWACVVPVQMAIADINARADLLQGYNLTYSYFDHEAIPGASVYRLVDKIYTEPPYVMVVGPILSIIATATAEIVHYWNLTQLAFAASSPVLSDRVRFPNFNRLSSPDSVQNPARYDLVHHFNWTKIAIIQHSAEFFNLVVQEFIEGSKEENLTVITQQLFLHSPAVQVRNLRDQDARIIFAFMYAEDARQVLCEAYKIGYYGPKIVWLFMAFLQVNFWMLELDDIDCTVSQMNLVAEGIFLLRHPEFKPKYRGIANMTKEEFFLRYRSEPTYHPETAGYDRTSHRCYDGIWAAALALNCTIETLKHIGHAKTLDQFNYTDSDITAILFDCLTNTTFVGVGTDINLSLDNRNPDVTFRIERVQNGEMVLLGSHNRKRFIGGFIWNDGVLQWKDGLVPRDAPVVIDKEVTLPLSLYLPMCGLSALGLLLTCLLFIFNVIYREKRSVKMSSPNINNVMLSGCMLCYISIFFKTVGRMNSSTCVMRTFCFAMGFTITFGALFSKTWRVYRIFTNKKLQRMSIRDRQLYVVNGALAGGVLVLLILWECIDPNHVIVVFLERGFYTNANGEDIHPYIYVCHSLYSSYFTWGLYIIEGALLTFGAFLAWETRHVNISALNDSRQIGMCLYNVGILSAMGVTVFLILEDEVTLYGATSACLIIGTTVTELVVFAPKVVMVFRMGKHVIEDTSCRQTESQSCPSDSLANNLFHKPVNHQKSMPTAETET